MSFYCYGPVYCPHCPPRFNKSQARVGEWLDCVVHNSSGCSVDIGECPKCGKRFQVSYTLNQIQELPND